MFQRIDRLIIKILNKIWKPLAKISIFIIFFYFGFLKIIGFSPAGPLVDALRQKTSIFASFDSFIIFFGLYEMFIGVAFVIPKLERLAIFLLFVHMIVVASPLIFLPQITWQRFLIPAMEGQYIIKNLAIISLALAIGAHLGKKG